jgi:hypothetical protein
MTDAAAFSSAGEPALGEVEGPAVRRASSPALAIPKSYMKVLPDLHPKT